MNLRIAASPISAPCPTACTQGAGRAARGAAVAHPAGCGGCRPGAAGRAQQAGGSRRPREPPSSPALPAPPAGMSPPRRPPPPASAPGCTCSEEAGAGRARHAAGGWVPRRRRRGAASSAAARCPGPATPRKLQRVRAARSEQRVQGKNATKTHSPPAGAEGLELVGGAAKHGVRRATRHPQLLQLAAQLLCGGQQAQRAARMSGRRACQAGAATAARRLWGPRGNTSSAAAAAARQAGGRRKERDAAGARAGARAGAQAAPPRLTLLQLAAGQVDQRQHHHQQPPLARLAAVQHVGCGGGGRGGRREAAGERRGSSVALTGATAHRPAAAPYPARAPPGTLQGAAQPQPHPRAAVAAPRCAAQTAARRRPGLHREAGNQTGRHKLTHRPPRCSTGAATQGPTRRHLCPGAPASAAAVRRRAAPPPRLRPCPQRTQHDVPLPGRRLVEALHFQPQPRRQGILRVGNHVAASSPGRRDGPGRQVGTQACRWAQVGGQVAGGARRRPVAAARAALQGPARGAACQAAGAVQLGGPLTWSRPPCSSGWGSAP